MLCSSQLKAQTTSTLTTMSLPAPRLHTRKYLYLYLDYHNVLDSGHDKLREMAKFLKRLDELGKGMYRTLISFGGTGRNHETPPSYRVRVEDFPKQLGCKGSS